MRLGIFGGTFDPIHSGHLRAVIGAADQHALDQVLVIPCGTPPHKRSACHASYEHRYRMVALACEADRRLNASRLEEPLADGRPRYTVDTIERVRAEFRYTPPLHFVIGADAFAEVSLWREVKRVAAAVSFLVVGRPGASPPRADSRFRVAGLVDCAHPASSNLVRHRVKIGGSLADLAPPEVCAYIWEHGLYRF